eukprot:NODE_15860_length_1025_cov_9.890869.p1 GENE.NODE_15860_length_1025_cov_9.890869~~NODE_15860_length_1025_cov_9.890869.p1  ORF type:complete len:265 (-),score=67.58 NODE_15860_length_1025_cov_9.890869:119-913(-)
MAPDVSPLAPAAALELFLGEAPSEEALRPSSRASTSRVPITPARSCGSAANRGEDSSPDTPDHPPIYDGGFDPGGYGDDGGPPAVQIVAPRQADTATGGLQATLKPRRRADAGSSGEVAIKSAREAEVLGSSRDSQASDSRPPRPADAALFAAGAPSPSERCAAKNSRHGAGMPLPSHGGGPPGSTPRTRRSGGSGSGSGSTGSRDAGAVPTARPRSVSRQGSDCSETPSGSHASAQLSGTLRDSSETTHPLGSTSRRRFGGRG